MSEPLVLQVVRSGTKECCQCHRWLEFKDFERRSAGSRRKAWCRDCVTQKELARYHADPVAARARHLKRTYGIDLVDYEELLRAQGGACAICRTTTDGDDSLHVDHDHTSGAIRGLLCRGCNTGLGGFGDKSERLRAALEYLDLPPK